MIRFTTFFRLLPVLVLAGWLCGLSPLALAADDKGTLYTAYNLWYEKPTRISSVNYHIGGMIPVGSKVSSAEVTRKEIIFTLAAGGEFRIQFGAKYHPGLTIEQFKERLLVAESPENQIKKLSAKEQDWVKKGLVEAGMSKEGVLLSWGPPAEHKTPNQSMPTWTYFRDHWSQPLMVDFADGKVSAVR